MIATTWYGVKEMSRAQVKNSSATLCSESCLTFSAVWPSPLGLLVLSDKLPRFALTGNVVVSLDEGKLGDFEYLQLICIDFHILVTDIYTRIIPVVHGQDSVNVSLV